MFCFLNNENLLLLIIILFVMWDLIYKRKNVERLLKLVMLKFFGVNGNKMI